MIASGCQNQLQFSLAPLGDLLKALMFLSNLNSFNSSPSLPVQGFNQKKGSSRVWKEKSSKWILSLSSLSLCFCFCIIYVFCFYFESIWFLCFALFNMFLFVFNFVFFFVFFFYIKKIKIKIEKSEKYKNIVCSVYIGTCVPWMVIEIKFSKLCIFCILDEHLYAQLSK